VSSQIRGKCYPIAMTLGMKKIFALTLLLVSVLGLGLGLRGSYDYLAAIYVDTLITLANKDRGQGSELKVNELLTKAAQNKANDMASKGYFSHVTPEGRTPWEWITEAGYRYTYAGENLAVNFENSEDVNNAWLNSPGHRSNIMNSKFTEIGIATAEGMYNGHKATYVVQMFGTPQKATYFVDKKREVKALVTPKTVPEVLGDFVAVKSSPVFDWVPIAASLASFAMLGVCWKLVFHADK
jgi:hypothetical protein